MLHHQLPDGPGTHPPPASRPAGFVSTTTSSVLIPRRRPPARVLTPDATNQPAGLARRRRSRSRPASRTAPRVRNSYLSSNII